MATNSLPDERLKCVMWRDLVPLKRGEIVSEVALSLPWLLLSLALASFRIYPAALALSFVFFLAGLRQVHNAFHYALGLSRAILRCRDVRSKCANARVHARRAVNHLAHHTHCLSEHDVEGTSARITGWQAILTGPATLSFPPPWPGV